MLDAEYTLEGTAEFTKFNNSVKVLFNKKESGVVFRFKTPITYTKDYLFIAIDNFNGPIKLNVKFWGNQTYQASYLSAESGQSYIRINLKPVKNIGPITIIKVYCDDILNREVMFNGSFTRDKVEDQTTPTFKDSIIPNGDFEWGMTNWVFWANQGQFRQATKYQPDSYGLLEYQSGDKGEVFVCTELFDLDPGEYTLRMDLYGNGEAAWKIAWEGDSGISGGFYKDRFKITSHNSQLSTFKVTKPMRCRLYIMWYSPSSLGIRGVRLWKSGTGNRVLVNNDIFVDGKKEFIIGYYAKANDPFTGLFRHIQPDGIPSKKYLDQALAEGKFIWPEISGAVRARAANISEINQLWDHPAVGGVYCDEPDHMQTGVRPEEIEEIRYNLKGGYPLLTTVMSWNESIMYQYEEAGDILGIELYPVINRKNIQWCRETLKRAVGLGRPVIAVIEASNFLSESEQKELLWMTRVEGAKGVFVWNEGLDKDPVKLEAFKKNLKEFQLG